MLADPPTAAPDAPSRLSWLNIGVLGGVHLVALGALAYLIFVRCSWWSVALGFAWWQLSTLAISGGYHRLFAHGAYRAAAPLRLFYLLFGAAAVQNSALKWAADHRLHHAACDEPRDPYNIRKGFWWAHVGWVLRRDTQPMEIGRVRDLIDDPLVRWQHRHYVLLALVMTLLVPAAIGLAWGDPLGAALMAGTLRLVLLWHSTFSINSVAHSLGGQPYCTRTSARDSFWTALVSLGEGYHNFHHRFQADYRNGVRWFHFDPTKWFLWTVAKLRVARDLRRTPREAIQRARDEVRAGRA